LSGYIINRGSFTSGSSFNVDFDGPNYQIATIVSGNIFFSVTNQDKFYGTTINIQVNPIANATMLFASGWSWLTASGGTPDPGGVHPIDLSAGIAGILALQNFGPGPAGVWAAWKEKEA